MKKITSALFCGLLTMVVLADAIPRQVKEKTDITADKNLVVALRLLNTEQVNYMDRNHRFADRDQILSFLREEEPGALRNLPIDLQDANSYELAITTSTDGQHYQITLLRSAAPDDKEGACQSAAFSDDRAVIYLGRALGCAPSNAY